MKQFAKKVGGMMGGGGLKGVAEKASRRARLQSNRSSSVRMGSFRCAAWGLVGASTLRPCLQRYHGVTTVQKLCSKNKDVL